MHPLLYELNTRCWLRQLSDLARRPVTLQTVPDSEFIQWERWGITHLWLMGAWTSGPQARAQALTEANLRASYAEAVPDWSESDVTASPYAIADYSVPAALGGNKGLDHFRRRLHQHGLKLILDFVPNHLGLDHPWVHERPELFVQSRLWADCPPAGFFRLATASGERCLGHGRDPYFPAWNDTVQLDYRQADTQETMRSLLASVAARCDGVRCDMAMLLLSDIFAKTWDKFPALDPNPGSSPSGGEFWSSAIAGIKREHPQFLFLAEAYWGTEARLHGLGFDYTYDKVLYDRLLSRDALGVQLHLLGLPAEQLAAQAHFLENHDEPRVGASLSPGEQRAAATVILGLPGLRFLHEGQLSGARRRAPVQLARRAAEPVENEISEMYEQLLTAISQSAVGRGEFEIIRPARAWPDNPTAQNFVIVQWRPPGSECDLVVVNLAPHRSQCCAPLRLAKASAWSLRDRLGPERYTRSPQELQDRGLFLDLPAHGAQIFHFLPS